MKVVKMATVSLENEMDLVLAHKKSMRLAELAGLSLPAQTTFATAVSEIARETLDGKRRARLNLSVEKRDLDNYIVAGVEDTNPNLPHTPGSANARKLISQYEITHNGNSVIISLFYLIPTGRKLERHQLDEWVQMLRNEPALSAYDEIKKKNEQLQELSTRIQESEERYRTLTNTLPMVIVSLDADKKIIYANQWLYRYTGLSLSELNETQWSTVIFPDDYAAFSSLMLSGPSAAQFRQERAQCRLLCEEDQQYYWHLFVISPVIGEDKQIISWTGYLVDIHAQKLFEQTLQKNEELKHAQEALELNIAELNRSNDELRQFAFVASHDLQEPVRKISFYSEYIMDRYKNLMDDEAMQYLNRMASAATRMRTLILDLLSYSQIDRNKFHPAKVNLNEVVADSLADVELSIAEKGANIVVQENLGIVYGDRLMIHRLMVNLIGNALKYSRKNIAPAIKVYSDADNGTLRVMVEDNGIGFEDEHSSKIFSLFQRLHTQAEYPGTGLGLAISQKIVSIHGGNISATGKINEGATFTVSLPAAEQFG